MVDHASPQEVLNTAVFGAIKPGEDPLDRQDVNQSNQEAIAGLPPGSALLIVVRGPNLGARFLLNQPRTTVGRKPSSDIFLDDVTVSRKHAEFVQNGIGGYEMRDSGSLNGTYVNRERSDRVELRSGDEVQIGKYRMIYCPSQANTAAVPAPPPANQVAPSGPPASGAPQAGKVPSSLAAAPTGESTGFVSAMPPGSESLAEAGIGATTSGTNAPCLGGAYSSSSVPNLRAEGAGSPENSRSDGGLQ